MQQHGNPLEQTFDLAQVVPGTASDRAAEWRRAVPALGRLTARVDGATLRLEDAGRVLTNGGTARSHWH
jgi:hypothetical protein